VTCSKKFRLDDFLSHRSDRSRRSNKRQGFRNENQDVSVAASYFAVAAQRARRRVQPFGEVMATQDPGRTRVRADRHSPTPIVAPREDLRLDVDGRYPQLVASGTSFIGVTSRVHWIANLAAAGADHWTGAIWYKDGNRPRSHILTSTSG
jgi:hypothetical protein